MLERPVWHNAAPCRNSLILHSCCKCYSVFASLRLLSPPHLLYRITPAILSYSWLEWRG